MQQPVNQRLVMAGLCGGVGILMAIYGNTSSFVAKTGMAQQRAFTVGNLYHMVHSIAAALIAIAVPKVKEVKGKVACDLGIAYCCFAVGTTVLSVSRYVQSMGSKQHWWLDLASRMGGTGLALGWGFVIAAAAHSA